MSFTKFHTSPIETYKTAVGTSDGSILVYDIQDRTRDTPLLHLERRHSKSVTGVAFSSVNPQLLASSSADGTLQFFDIRSGETIQELASLSTPITSLSMHAGGVHCAIGSEAGEVFVYDLRQNSPVASMYAHNLIKCLQFAPIPKSKKEKEKEIGSTPQSVTYDAPPADPGKPKGSYFGPSSSQMKTSPQKLGRTPSPSKSNMAMSGATRDTPRQESKSNVGDRYSASRKNEATEPKPNMVRSMVIKTVAILANTTER
jgi:WD40 repeat protein